MSAASTSRVVAIDLGPGPDAAELVARVSGWDGLLCLHGDWAGAAAVLTSHPTRVCTRLDAALDALDEQPSVDPAPPDLPATRPLGGGWFGWLAYDGESRLAFHDHLLRLVDGAWWFEALWSDDRDAALRARLAAWREVLAAGSSARPGPWHVGGFDGPGRSAHLRAVERAVELIRAGELYQVNVCTRLSAAFTGDPAAMFGELCADLRPVRGAFVAGEGRAVVSLSPELFLHRDGRRVRTSPIKGTLPRADDASTEDDGAQVLRRSAKDAAENVMIVDLMRNDLGRVCTPGTVRVASLLGVQPHPGVWHLVSTVEGELRPDVGDAELLRATFPPGSVTGAPKVRAVRAIADLEAGPRGGYTGAIGFASPLRGAEFSVAIRTFEIADGRVELGVGGGVTADSVPMLEWRECLHKAAALLRAAGTGLVDALATPDRVAGAAQLAGGLLETMLCRGGKPLRLADHLARLDRSCRELYGAGAPDDLTARARAAAALAPVDRAVLRVVVRPSDTGMVAEVTATGLTTPWARPAQDAVVSVRSKSLWRHKWADRAELTALEKGSAPGVPLFLGADGTVQETARGNLFLVEPDGGLVTPPLTDDLLPGVTRRALLDLARDRGRPTTVRPVERSELVTRPAFWTSSVSGAVELATVDGVALPSCAGLVGELRGALTGGADDRSLARLTI